MGFLDIFRNYRKRIEERNESCNNIIDNVVSVNQSIEDWLNKESGYLFEYEYSSLLLNWNEMYKKWQNLEYSLRKASRFREMRSYIYQFHITLTGIQQRINIHNNDYIKKAVNDAYKMIGQIEGRPLDFLQMSCVVKNTSNHLVVAGAGTGKTTTIIGKVKYLIESKLCGEDEILVLSFTNAAASEMKARMVREIKRNIMVSTFHKLGLDIIKETDGIVPRIHSGDTRKFIHEQIDFNLANPDYKKLYMQYLLFCRVNQKSEFDFDSESSYQEYLRTNPPTTIRGETVKSYGEVEIANFLTQYGIEYIYEHPYKIDTRSTEYGQYYPDFFLPEYNIYIEYFGINRNREVPSYFTGRDGKSAAETYNEGITWKQSIHQTNHTILIECFAYERFEANMLDNLYTKLQEQSIPLRPISTEQLFAQMDTTQKNEIEGLSELFQTVLSLMKNSQLTINALYELCSSKGHKEQMILIQLFAPVYEAYENMLASEGAIDFNDMIIMAQRYVMEGKYHHKYKHVIIDEYQDISKGQYHLLQAMRQDSFFSLFCVGDDWQSIYRFAGSDIGYTLHFARYWGNAEISRIETTYRFSQRLIAISSEFIMKNPNQLKKTIKAFNNTEKQVLGEISGFTDKLAIRFMISKLYELPINSTVFFIGRYQFDSDLLCGSDQLTVSYDNVNKIVNVRLHSRPDLQMAFYTAHKSKGLQADYVIIINNRATNMGFPSKVQNPPLIDLLLEQADTFPNAEERRLFYVAMTRAKKKVYLVTVGNNLSEFVKELKHKYQDEMKKEAFTCPTCGAPLAKREGKYGAFYGCTGYKKTGCRYTRNINKKDGGAI